MSRKYIIHKGQKYVRVDEDLPSSDLAKLDECRHYLQEINRLADYRMNSGYSHKCSYPKGYVGEVKDLCRALKAFLPKIRQVKYQ